MTRETSRGLRLFNAACLAIGLVLLVWTIRRTGLGTLVDLIGSVGPWFPVLFGMYLLWTGLEAAALHFFMRPEQRTVSYWRVFAVQAGAEAVNGLTPTGKFGEATKVTQLIGHAPRPRAVAAVLLYNLVSALLSWTTVVIGIPVTLALFDLPPSLARGLLIAAGAVLVLAALLVLWVRSGLLDSLLAAAKVVRLITPERRKRWASALANVDRELRAWREPGNGLVGGALFLVAARLVYWSELYVILHAMGARPSLAFMVGVTAVGIVFNTLTSVVPLQLGVAEGGAFAIYRLLGVAPELGVGATLIRRARWMVTASLGLLLMTVAQLLDRRALARAERRMRDRHDSASMQP